MTEVDTSSAAKTLRDLAWAKINARVSELVKESALNPTGKLRTREVIFADFLNTREGAAMYAEYRTASDTPIEKLVDLSVVGPIAPVVDALIKDGGKEIRKRDPSLSSAEAVVKFLETEDGRNLYQLGASLPAGATFEANPQAVRHALGMAREQVVKKGGNLRTIPLTLQFSALLRAVV